MSRLPSDSLRYLALALASAVLQILAFPGFNQPWCAWVALVPWLLLLRGLSARDCLRLSWLIGFLFFLGSIYWLIHVTFFGWIVLCAYLALFFGVFGLAARQLDDQPLIARLLLLPSAWVALEFTRSHLLSGLGWNLLAYSQTPYLPVIQLADATGAWGVSWLIVFVNGATAMAAAPRSPRRLRATCALIAGGCLLAAVAYGLWRLLAADDRPTVRIAVVQGNIPQEQKWDETYEENILRRYESLSRKAAEGKPELIIWPETSVPGYVGVEEEITQRIIRLAREVKTPLLVGSPAPKWTPDGFLYVNRAILIDAAGNLAGQYDKLHLVPFGEFVPGERHMPWLRKILPPIGDFTAGDDHTVFAVPAWGQKAGFKFSVLICFEDVFPDLAREFVRRGAQALLVITNDAWFGPTAAAYQHAQASTFRAVELRVPVIRAANTGWSGCIDAFGRWHNPVKGANGRELFVEGFAACDTAVGPPPALYRHFGDWFAWLCVLTSTGWFIIMALRRRKKS